MTELFKRMLLVMVVILAGLFVLGCEPDIEVDDAVAPGQAEIEAEYMFGGGNPGGTWFTAVGGGVIILDESVEGYRISYGSSAGSLETVRRMATGEYDLGFAHANTLLEAVSGTGDFEGVPTDEILVLAHMEPFGLAFYTLEGSGVNNASDLEGKTISMGPAGSGGLVHATQITEVLGILDTISVETLGWSDGGRALLDGHVDVAVSITGPYTSGVLTEVSMQRPLTFVDFSDVMDVLVESFPYYTPLIVPSGQVAGVDNEPIIVSWDAFWVARDDLPEEVAYDVLRITVLEKNTDLKAIQRGWGDISPDFDVLAGLGLKLHPGAVKFWQDQGIEIPLNLIP